MRSADFARSVRAAFPLAAVVVMLSLVGFLPSAGQAGPEPLIAASEPTAAAGFIAAHRDSDATRASRITSPLYHAEMERRGLGGTWPISGLWTDAAAQLDFSFVGAVSDSSGFTYALYTARPKRPVGRQSPASVWRIDLDPKGRVIWGEAARVLDSPQVEPVGRLQDGRWPSALSRGAAASPIGARLRLVMGVRSAAGDAYVAVRPNSGDPNRIEFAQEDASGQLGPSYWSYNEAALARGTQQRSGGTGTYHRGALSSTDARMLSAYLGAIGWSPGRA